MTEKHFQPVIQEGVADTSGTAEVWYNEYKRDLTFLSKAPTRQHFVQRRNPQGLHSLTRPAGYFDTTSWATLLDFGQKTKTVVIL